MLETFYLAAWNDLSTERPIGMAEGPIPRSKIRAYGIEEFGLDGDDLDFFIRVMRRIDDGYRSGDLDAAPTGRKGVRDQVSVNDAAGVRRLLSRLAAPPGGRDPFVKSPSRPHARKRHRQDHHDPS